MSMYDIYTLDLSCDTKKRTGNDCIGRKRQEFVSHDGVSARKQAWAAGWTKNRVGETFCPECSKKGEGS